MYYEDESRRMNLVSGLLSGLLLGVAIVLLLKPGRIGRTRLQRRVRGENRGLFGRKRRNRKRDAILSMLQGTRR